MDRYNRLTVSRLFVLAAVFAAAQSAFADADSSAGYDDIMQPTCRIRYERMQDGAIITGHGTAFGVDLSRFGYSGKRYLLTAAHNVLDDRHRPWTTLKIEIRYKDGREMWAPVKAVVWDDSLDLCIVESSEDLPSLVQLSDVDMNVGSPVLLTGSPRGIPVGLYRGTVQTRFYNATVRTAAQIPFDHGDSGGPFFCARTRKVVGVAVAGVPKDGDLDHNIGLFVPMAGVMSFLEQNARVRVEPRAIAVEKRAEPAVAAPVVASAPAKKAQAPLILDEDAHSEVVELRPRASRDPLPAPQAKPAPAVVAANQNSSAIPMKLDTGPDQNIVKATYVVQLGDNLTTIAKRHNVSIRSLLTANTLNDPNVLKPGMKLNIP
jgi:LysM repeat protein